MFFDDSISVVIPTTLRDTLQASLSSVEQQTWHGRIEIIIVVDAETSVDLPDFVGTTSAMPRRVLFTGGGRGAAFARNMGVDAATGDYVAFLDDDDLWRADKLDLQYASLTSLPLSQMSAPLIASSRIKHERHGRINPQPVPRSTIALEEPVEQFLFLKRRPAVTRASLYTSTLMVPTSLAQAIRWDDGLKRHQDWDWLIRAQRIGGARVVQLSPPLVTIVVGSTNSISSSADWSSSLNWAKAQTEVWRPQVLADFLTAQTLRYALQDRSLRGVLHVLIAIIRTRRVPSIGPVGIGVAGAVPRSLINEALGAGARSAIKRRLLRPGSRRR